MARTVLIVDDVAFVRQTLGEILSKSGYQVIGEAADGNQAVEMYFKLKPSIVTMDVVMPALSGIEATRKIVKIDKDARIVMVSAMGQDNLVMEAINAGARDYVMKPFKPQDIVQTLDRIMHFSDPKAERGKSV